MLWLHLTQRSLIPLPLPIVVTDTPSYNWALATDVAIIVTAVAAIVSIGFYWWSFARSGHRISITAEADKLNTVRIRVINTGRMPVEIKYVGLGSLYEKRGCRRKSGLIPLRYQDIREGPTKFEAVVLEPGRGKTWYFLWPPGAVEKRIESKDGKTFTDWEAVTGPTDKRVFAAVLLHHKQHQVNVEREPNDFLIYDLPF